MLLDNQFHIPERKRNGYHSGKEKGRQGKEEGRIKGGRIEEGEREGQRRKEGGREGKRERERHGRGMKRTPLQSTVLDSDIEWPQ